MTLIERLAALNGVRRARDPLHGRRGRRRRLEAARPRVRRARRDAPEEASAQFDELIRRGRNTLLALEDGTKVFVEWYGPPPRLFVYGAVDTAEALCRGAKLLGWKVIVADARAKFATAERIPSADELIVAWPDDAFAQVEPDHQTAIVVLTHDDKFDEPALAGALATEAFYIGALGSRRNQERRRERLLEAGVAESRARPDHGAVRARHRRGHAGGDRALDPLGDPRGARAPRGRLPQGREEAHPRRGRVTRVAIVTGAGRGLGEAIARRLHGDGYRVALADIDGAGADRVAGELGEGALAFLHDIRDLDSWERLLREVRAALGDDVHALVNNAARTEIRSFWEIDVDEWDDVLATNLRGTYLGCRVVGAYLRDRGAGQDRQSRERRRAGEPRGHRRALRDLEGGDRRAHAPCRDRARARMA